MPVANGDIATLEKGVIGQVACGEVLVDIARVPFQNGQDLVAIVLTVRSVLRNSVWSRRRPASQVEVGLISTPAIRDAIGIDLGVKIFAALSTGEKVVAPDYSRLERKIRCAQRQLSRRQKGSKRRERARLKVVKLKAKQADTRHDFLHKLSTQVVQENQLVCLEDLNVSGMVKNRCLSRAISRAGWRAFRVLCEGKSVRYENREVRTINRWEPTSQYYSVCGYRWGKLDLKVREVVCLGCGATHCRDEHASRNIEHVGAGHVHDAKRIGREYETPVGAVPVELSTPFSLGVTSRR